MIRHSLVALVSIICCAAFGHAQTTEKRLVDGDVKQWTNLELPKAKEPPVTISANNGRLTLKFAGGRWPTIVTTNVPDDWMPYHSLKATLTVTRPCLVGFAAFQEKSSRDSGWDGTISRWVKTVFAQPGKNEISASLHPHDYSAIHAKYGKVVRFEIFMYNPKNGEEIIIENLRLSSTKEPATPTKTAFKVLGTNETVSGVMELGKKLKDQWKPPTPKSVEDIEKDFRATFSDIKKTHPRAVLATFRDGDKGFDPGQPDKIYQGWKDAYWSSHGPDGMTIERSTNFGKAASQEIFMRHRSPLMRVELGSIPKGARIHAARLIIVRGNDTYDKERDPRVNANMWVAEACNRPWEEHEVNAYEYAKDKFWKSVGGMQWDGDDPDFLPIYLAYGPGGGAVSSWDFTHAVRFWTDGKHANHGFMLHSDARDWMSRAHYREAKDVRHRPALLVIYEPE